MDIMLRFLFAALIIAIPLLGVIAFFHVRRLEQRFPRNLPERLAALERQLGELNRKLNDFVTGGEPGGVSAPQVTPPTTPPPQVATPSPAVPSALKPAPPPPPSVAETAPAARSGLDIETLIAGRWLNRIGIVALLLSVAFFLMYAFDNQWVGPTGRVLIGLLAGAALLYYSHWLLGRGYRYFSEGIAGLGAGVLYLSLYAAWNFYQLVPQSVAFAGMIAVTGAMIYLSVLRNAQSIAFLALIGGFLTPALLGAGQDAQVVLFSYLAVLNGGLLWLVRWRRWRALELVALLGTIVYFADWYSQFYQPDKLLLTSFFATLFFAEFATLPLLEARQRRAQRGIQIALVLVNVTWYFFALQAMLYSDHRWSLTLWVLALAAAHLGAVRLVPPTEDGQPSTTRILYAGLALTFLTLAIPIRLEDHWITTAWAVEGVVLIWSGFGIQQRLLRWFGLALFGLTALRVWVVPVAADRFLLNARFGAFAVVVACFAVAWFLARRNTGTLSGDEQLIFNGVGLASNVFLWASISMEVWDAFGRMPAGGLDLRLAQQLSLSLLWILYASVLIVVGIRRALPALRWQGLALTGVVVAKAFLIDLTFLDRVYRILSFFVLGVVLLVVSFLYQKRMAAARTEEKTTKP